MYNPEFDPLNPISSAIYTPFRYVNVLHPDIHPNPNNTPLDLHNLLGAVARGKRDEVEKILTDQPELMLKKPQGEDSPFQMAVWGLNWHMWETMLKCLPTEKYQEALAQLLELENPANKRGSHYDIAPLINAMQNFLNGFALPELLKRQLEIPTALLIEYCRRDQDFHPIPDFNRAPPLDCSIRFYNHVATDYVYRQGLPRYVIVRADDKVAKALSTEIAALVAMRNGIEKDLPALNAWNKVAIQKRQELKQRLQNIVNSQKAVQNPDTSHLPTAKR